MILKTPAPEKPIITFPINQKTVPGKRNQTSGPYITKKRLRRQSRGMKNQPLRCGWSGFGAPGRIRTAACGAY